MCILIAVFMMVLYKKGHSYFVKEVKVAGNDTLNDKLWMKT